MTSCGRSRCLASFHTFTRICNGKRRRRGLIMLFPRSVFARDLGQILATVQP
jgi:hypothetical protein